MECRPVSDVEDQKNDWEGDEDSHVQLARLVLGAGRCQLSECLDLHLQEDDRVLKERAKHEEDAADDPGLHGVQPVGLRGVGGRCVENIHLKIKQEQDLIIACVPMKSTFLQQFLRHSKKQNQY